MNIEDINETVLLLLTKENNLTDLKFLPIEKIFVDERKEIENLCSGSYDNIDEIVNFIKNKLKPKLPNRVFNYCQELDKAFQSVIINIEDQIRNIITSKDLIYVNKEIAEKNGNYFNLANDISKLKENIFKRILLWFKAFEIDFAYEKTKEFKSVLVFSHRLSGWSNPEYQITENLTQEIKTNFGYGKVSYFYSLLTFKNIQIIPLSEWIDYRFANFSDVIRYTKSFKKRMFVENKGHSYFRVFIQNKFWYEAMTFTKDAANLSVTNEQQFVEKYIIEECELMVQGLDHFLNSDEIDVYEEINIPVDKSKNKKTRLNIKGFEMIDFKTEKIIGALHFIQKINEYNKITPTDKFVKRIIEINKNFIPKVYETNNYEKNELKIVSIEFNEFLIEHNELSKKNDFYRQEKIRLNQKEFDNVYGQEYEIFNESLKISIEKYKYLSNKINLHKRNIEKMEKYIENYNSYVK